MRTLHHAATTLLALTIILPCVAGAADESQARTPIAAAENAHTGPVPLAVPASPKAADAQDIGTAIDSSKLDEYRGGSDEINEVVNKIKLNGAVNDNTAINVATGGNVINQGAFANASGIPTVIQNTGANVLIQNAMIVNLQFK